MQELGYDYVGTVRGALFQLLRDIHQGMRWLGIAFATKAGAASVEKLLVVQRVDSHSVATHEGATSSAGSVDEPLHPVESQPAEEQEARPRIT